MMVAGAVELVQAEEFVEEDDEPRPGALYGSCPPSTHALLGRLGRASDPTGGCASAAAADGPSPRPAAIGVYASVRQLRASVCVSVRCAAAARKSPSDGEAARADEERLASQGLKPTLSFWDAVCLIVGTMVLP